MQTLPYFQSSWACVPSLYLVLLCILLCDWFDACVLDAIVANLMGLPGPP